MKNRQESKSICILNKSEDNKSAVCFFFGQDYGVKI